MVLLGRGVMFGALTKTDKCNAMRECANNHWHGWCANGWAGGAKGKLTGIMETAVYNFLHCFFFIIIAKHSCLCKTSLAINPDPDVGMFECWYQPTPTEILQDIQVQRHMKCVDAEQLCCKGPKRKPCQTSRQCEGQKWLSLSLSFSSLTLLPPPHPLSLELRQTFRAAEMSQGLQKQN